MCSYWRCCLEPTPRTCFLSGIAFLPSADVRNRSAVGSNGAYRRSNGHAGPQLRHSPKTVGSSTDAGQAVGTSALAAGRAHACIDVQLSMEISPESRVANAWGLT